MIIKSNELLRAVFFKLKIKTDSPAKKQSALLRVPRGEFLAEETIISKALGYLNKLPEGHCAESIEHERDRAMEESVRDGKGQI